MATTLSDIQTSLAYRLGEDSAPSDANELARRKSYINEGYRKICNENYWWFAQDIGSQDTLNGQEIYTLPSDFRDIIELRLNRTVCKFIPQEDAMGTYNYPPTYYQYRSIVQRFYIYGDQELHLLPVPTSTPSTLTVSSITQTSGTATATTSTTHSLLAGDYVLLAGADQSGYNGTVRVLSVPTTTTFTYSVDSSTVSPATGTITAQWQNLVYRYWQYATNLSADSDAIIIPDQFSDIVVAYAFGRYSFVDDMRANAGDGFEEYNQHLKNLIAENNRRLIFGKATPPQSPEYYLD
jgi:hypothetical protein